MSVKGENLFSKSSVFNRVFLKNYNPCNCREFCGSLGTVKFFAAQALQGTIVQGQLLWFLERHKKRMRLLAQKIYNYCSLRR
jgi:hypothetical protein